MNKEFDAALRAARALWPEMPEAVRVLPITMPEVRIPVPRSTEMNMQMVPWPAAIPAEGEVEAALEAANWEEVRIRPLMTTTGYMLSWRPKLNLLVWRKQRRRRR